MRLPLFAVLLLTAATPLAAQAQQAAPAAIDARVGKLEKEMKAVQRKVFPGGDTRYFEPEIAPPAPAADAAAAGVPATNPVTDLTARVNALETSLQQLTGQVEQNGFKLRQLEEAVAKMRGDTDYRLGLLEGGAPKPAAPVPEIAPTPTPATPAGTAAAPVKAPVAAAPKPAAATPTPAQPAATTPKPVPSTGDAAEDAYNAAYRLWADKKYAEAEAALEAWVAKYPKHKRASFANNLLGRAYLDDGQPAAAAKAFYANYEKLPAGERAPESLYYLGQSLVKLKKPADACRVYTALTTEYGAKISAALKAQVAKARVDAKCAP